MLTKSEVEAILLAIFGSVLLVTRGHMVSLLISCLALLFGLGSAVTLTIYTVQPARLLATYSSSLVIGWGMFFFGWFSR